MAVNFEEADKAIRSIAKLESGRNGRNLSLGWYGAQLKLGNLWTQHGYKDEAAYRDAVGIGVAIWGRYLRIAGELIELPLAEFVKMSAENAEVLGMLPIAWRYGSKWIHDAQTMKAEDFKREALKVQAAAAGVEAKDMRVKFSLPLFEAQRSVIKAGVKEFAREHQIKDDGTALEWLVLEYSERKTFYKFIQEQLPRLSMALNNGFADECHLALGMHIAALKKMLDNLKG